MCEHEERQRHNPFFCERDNVKKVDRLFKMVHGAIYKKVHALAQASRRTGGYTGVNTQALRRKINATRDAIIGAFSRRRY